MAKIWWAKEFNRVHAQALAAEQRLIQGIKGETVTDEEIDAFVASTMGLNDKEFIIEVAKLVRAQRQGWTLKAAAALVRRVAEGKVEETPSE